MKRSCCLQCPFSECVFDTAGKQMVETSTGESVSVKSQRDRHIITLYQNGWSVEKIAKATSLSIGSVRKIAYGNR